MNPIEERGRWLLAAIIGVTLTSDAVVIFLTVARRGLLASGGSLPRWFITAALRYAVWRGYRWARWLTVVLLGTACLLVVSAVLRSAHPLLVGMAIQFGVTAGLLALSRSISAFLAFQRITLHENS